MDLINTNFNPGRQDPLAEYVVGVSVLNHKIGRIIANQQEVADGLGRVVVALRSISTASRQKRALPGCLVHI